LYLHMEASQHSLLAACFTLHSINATLAIVPQRGAGLWIQVIVKEAVNITNHPIENPLLFVTEPQTRDNIQLLQTRIARRNQKGPRRFPRKMNVWMDRYITPLRNHFTHFAQRTPNKNIKYIRDIYNINMGRELGK
jgi:hypothetical protein